MNNQKIRVLHVIDTTGPAGAEIVLLNILKGLDKNIFQSFIVLPDKGWLYKKLLQLNNITIKIINGRGRFNVLFIYLISKFLIKNKIDIIHSHLFGSSLYCSIAGILCRVPVICTFHGFADINPKDKFLKLKFFIIGIWAKKIISVSNTLSNYLKTIVPLGERKCITIYNGIEVEKNGKTAKENTTNRLRFSKNDILVGSVGNIKKVKGYDILLRAAKYVRKRHKNCYFLIAGARVQKDFFNELLAERKILDLEKGFHFIGYKEDVYNFLQSLDIFVLPSITEGFSLATIEAMNAGIPVVATKSGGPEEIIINNKNGILVNSGDQISLADGISRLIENKMLREQFVITAKKTIIERFQISTMIQKYEDLYSK